MIRLLICTLIGFSLMMPSVIEAREKLSSWSELADVMSGELEVALKTYKGGGENKKAMEQVADVYFATFEGAGSNMEIAVRSYLSLKRATTLEKSFTTIRRAIHEGKKYGSVHELTLSLIEDLREAARELDDKKIEVK